MTKNKSRYFKEQFDGLAHEISILMVACDIDAYSDDVADRILSNDATICRIKNPQAFEKLRHHLLALYPLEERSIDRVGAEQTKEMLEEVRSALRKLRNSGRPDGAGEEN